MCGFVCVCLCMCVCVCVCVCLCVCEHVCNFFVCVYILRKLYTVGTCTVLKRARPYVF